jgi:predicted RND superfamily exporter protein
LASVCNLDFATGQDSYIDPASQVAKDNKDYQNLFGGEHGGAVHRARRQDGRDLFTPASVTKFKDIEAKMKTSDAVSSVVSPLTLRNGHRI